MYNSLKILLQQDEKQQLRSLLGRHRCHVEDFGLYSEGHGNEINFKALNVE